MVVFLQHYPDQSVDYKTVPYKNLSSTHNQDAKIKDWKKQKIQ